MPWRPEYPGEVPTLGWHFLEFCDLLNVPDRPGDDGVLVPTREQAEFALRFYEVDPVTGRRKYRRGALSRPRGWGKSPIAGAFVWFEALGCAVPDGWDADGRPVGKPWWTIRTPLVRVAAVSEAQTANTWSPIHDMVTDRLLDAFPGLEPMETFVALPYGRGRIEQITASAHTAKGQPSVFTLCDQIEVWYQGNGGRALHNVLATNLAKGRGGGHLMYTPNAFVPGTHSVAEELFEAVRAQSEGRTRGVPDLLYDHREAPADTDLTDRDSLTLGLRWAYGDSSDHPDGCVIHDPPCEAGWSPLESHIARVWDVDIDEQEARADFLNQITAASDSFVSQPEWAGCKTDSTIELGDAITLGFDGSRGRSKGKPDATALIGCRISDGHVFQVGVWEADDRPETWETWEPPAVEIESALAEVFDRYNVVGFYADPAATWRSFTSAWEARWGSGMVVKGRQGHPFEWWMTGQTSRRTEAAIEAFHAAVVERDLSHDGSWALTRHVLNARRRVERGRLKLEKESKSSGRKIDACIAAILAWQARLDAVSVGAGVSRRSVTVPARVRRRR